MHAALFLILPFLALPLLVAGEESARPGILSRAAGWLGHSRVAAESKMQRHVLVFDFDKVITADDTTRMIAGTACRERQGSEDGCSAEWHEHEAA